MRLVNSCAERSAKGDRKKSAINLACRKFSVISLFKHLFLDTIFDKMLIITAKGQEVLDLICEYKKNPTPQLKERLVKINTELVRK